MDHQEHKLRFYITSPHSCNYLDSRDATSLFADPLFPKNKSLYSALVANGFRRSGEHLYRPIVPPVQNVSRLEYQLMILIYVVITSET